MRKITIAFLSVVLYTGCSTVEKRDPDDCVDWRYYMTEIEECTGGRGVSPKMCVVRQVQRNFCVRWQESD